MPTRGAKKQIVYQIEAKQQKYWDKDNGEWVPVDPYTAPRKVWGVQIIEGKGETTKRDIAIEFADMGYKVTPNPKVAAPPREEWKEEIDDDEEITEEFTEEMPTA